VLDIILGVRTRWLSKRAVFLHLAFLLFVPVCVAATWWQVTRAEDGNDLSYLYSFMWPAFAIIGVYFWWMFLHTDYDTVGRKGLQHQMSPAPSSQSPAQVAAVEGHDDQDPDLAAYNARLAALATQGPKTWRNPETHVARKPQ
jgi:DNA-binding transcriptional regulator of glucitol operon